MVVEVLASIFKFNINILEDCSERTLLSNWPKWRDWLRTVITWWKKSCHFFNMISIIGLIFFLLFGVNKKWESLKKEEVFQSTVSVVLVKKKWRHPFWMSRNRCFPFSFIRKIKNIELEQKSTSHAPSKEGKPFLKWYYRFSEKVFWCWSAAG